MKVREPAPTSRQAEVLAVLARHRAARLEEVMAWENDVLHARRALFNATAALNEVLLRRPARRSLVPAIAAELGIKPRTVEHTLRMVRERCGILVTTGIPKPKAV